MAITMSVFISHHLNSSPILTFYLSLLDHSCIPAWFFPNAKIVGRVFARVLILDFNKRVVFLSSFLYDIMSILCYSVVYCGV